MKISALKSMLRFHKGPRDNGLMPLISSWFRSYSPVIGEVENFANTFAVAEADRELTCEEEMKLAGILFSPTRSEDVQVGDTVVSVLQWEMTEDDRKFVRGLKSELFGKNARNSRDILDWAERVYAGLKSLPKNLLQKKYADAIKESDYGIDVAEFLKVLAENSLLDDDTLALVRTTRRSRSEFVSILPQLKEAGILTRQVLNGLNSSEKPLDRLAAAYIMLNGAGILDDYTITLVNKCRCTLGEMVGVLIILNKDDVLNLGVDIYKFIQATDSSLGHCPGSLDTLVPIIRTLNKKGIFTQQAMDVFCQDVCAREDILRALIKLKDANLFEKENIALLAHRQQPSEIAEVIIMLAEAGLLANNMKKLQESCLNHELKRPLERLKEEGLLRQECLDMIWGRDPGARLETAILLGKAGLINKENCDALGKLGPYDFYSLNKKLELYAANKMLDQTNFGRIVRDEVNLSELRLLGAARNAVLSLGFIANMGKDTAALEGTQENDVKPAVKM